MPMPFAALFQAIDPIESPGRYCLRPETSPSIPGVERLPPFSIVEDGIGGGSVSGFGNTSDLIGAWT